MTLGPTAFAAVVWGAIVLVLGILAYQAYAVFQELGWMGPDRGRPDE